MYIVNNPYKLIIRSYKTFYYIVLINDDRLHNGYLFYIRNSDRTNSIIFGTILSNVISDFVGDDAEGLWYLIRRHDEEFIDISVNKISTKLYFYFDPLSFLKILVF